MKKSGEWKIRKAKARARVEASSVRGMGSLRAMKRNLIRAQAGR